MRTAKFEFVFKTSEEAKIVIKTLDPEIKNRIPKTNVNIRAESKTIFLEITATDTSSLRAAINSYLRWINTAINVKRIV